MRRWQYAAACAVAAAIMVAGSSGPAYAANNCTVDLMYEPSGRLYHGTPVLKFTGGGFHPRGPAWLGRNREFSIHAALRHVGAEAPIRILAFRHTRPLQLVECADTAEIERFAVEKRWLRSPAADRPDSEVAKALCNANLPNSGKRMRVDHKAVTLDGYRLRADAVRREVEYIICDPNAVLHFEKAVQQPVMTMPVGNRRQWATKGPDGVFMLLGNYGLQCLIRLPEDARAACPDHGTMPRVGCCVTPKPPPRRH